MNSPILFITNMALFGISVLVVFMTGQNHFNHNKTHFDWYLTNICNQKVQLQGKATRWCILQSLGLWWVHFLYRQINKQSSDRDTYCWQTKSFKRYHWSQCENHHTLYYIAEVTVVGAVIKQAVPEWRHWWTLNSNQVKISLWYLVT